MSETVEEMPTNAANQIDVNIVGCKIIDVHNCLQRAFEQFAENGDNTLDGLAKKIQEELGSMPVFLIGEQSGS